MDVKNMKKIIGKAFEREQRKERKKNMTENEKLRRAFIASAVATIAVGIIFVIVTTVSLMRIGDAVEEAPAQHYDLNCLTEVKDRPLEECRE